MVVFDLQHSKIQQIVKQEPLLLIDYLESCTYIFPRCQLDWIIDAVSHTIPWDGLVYLTNLTHKKMVVNHHTFNVYLSEWFLVLDLLSPQNWPPVFFVFRKVQIPLKILGSDGKMGRASGDFFQHGLVSSLSGWVSSPLVSSPKFRTPTSTVTPPDIWGFSQ